MEMVKLFLRALSNWFRSEVPARLADIDLRLLSIESRLTRVEQKNFRNELSIRGLSNGSSAEETRETEIWNEDHDKEST